MSNQATSPDHQSDPGEPPAKSVRFHQWQEERVIPKKYDSGRGDKWVRLTLEECLAGKFMWQIDLKTEGPLGGELATGVRNAYGIEARNELSGITFRLRAETPEFTSCFRYRAMMIKVRTDFVEADAWVSEDSERCQSIGVKALNMPALVKRKSQAH
ncbi:hypothetical protein BCR34DRAFT_586388 [Clohesyomyces aquaticus]|uniref:Uncharacterized protein n=1 Tax=Clohesyomyces aquaticus TaxID=1231657 RepID=A0A1Y1ZTP1_9PLEO|nr:hypothetical protein BCR34DRAFT_586388 [Clohesyomyces aquaticus]